MACGNDDMCQTVHTERNRLRETLQALVDASKARPFAQQPHAELMHAEALLASCDD
jgi:hypothetical protein